MYLQALQVIILFQKCRNGKVPSLKVPLGSTVHIPGKTSKLYKKWVHTRRNTCSFSEVKIIQRNLNWKLSLKMSSQLMFSSLLKTFFLTTVPSAVYLLNFTKYFWIKRISLMQRYLVLTSRSSISLENRSLETGMAFSGCPHHQMQFPSWIPVECVPEKGTVDKYRMPTCHNNVP